MPELSNDYRVVIFGAGGETRERQRETERERDSSDHFLFRSWENESGAQVYQGDLL